LNVEEAPVVSVPVVAPGNWMREKEPKPEPAPKPARFMSEDEETAESADDTFFFAAAAPGVATTVSVAVSPEAAGDRAMDLGVGQERAAAPAEQRLDELERESQYALQQRDYAADFNEGPRGGPEQAEPAAQPEPSLFPEPGGEPERDLDVPTFLRRLRF